MKVKSWFLNKEFTTDERIAISTVDPQIKKETEKATLLRWNTEFGFVEKWVPKSCIEEIKSITNELKDSFKAYKEASENLYNTIKKGSHVKKRGGRKIFTVTSDFISYGSVYVTDGRKEQKINIDLLEVVG